MSMIAPMHAARRRALDALRSNSAQLLDDEITEADKNPNNDGS
jgi:hypothetical protein